MTDRTQKTADKAQVRATRTEITIKDPQTLADVEYLCAQARELGFPDNAAAEAGWGAITFSDNGTGHTT